MSTLTRRVVQAAMGALVVPAYVVADHWLPSHLPLGVVLRGVVLGGLQGLVAMGLVLIYRSARIINFAQTAIGGVAASFAVILVVGYHWSYYVAVPLGLALSVAIGWIIDQVVARRLANAPRMTFTVATIGLALLLGAAEVELPKPFTHLSATTLFTTPFSFRFHLSPFVFSGDDLVAVVTVTVALLALHLFFQRTDTGTAIRAAADSSERALLLGIPIRRLSTITWMVAAGLSGVGAVLSASSSISGANLGVASGPATLLTPLAAAVLAGMDSLPMTMLWAVVLAVINQASTWSFHQAPYTDIIEFLLILGALLLRRRGDRSVDEFRSSSFVPVREVVRLSATMARRLDVRVMKVLGPIVIVVAAALVPLHLPASRVFTLAYVPIYGVIAVSIVLLAGWAGQISLGQFAFVGIGAALTGALIVHVHLDLLIAMVIAAAAGAVVACVVGIPALRLQGLYLAVTTLAFAVPVSSYLLSSAYVPWLNPQHVVPPVLFHRFNLSSPYTLYEFSLVVLVVAVMGASNLRRSWGGRAVVAVRDNPTTASTYGISPFKVRLMAFGVSGALAGLAGSLIVVAQAGIPPSGFPPDESVNVFAMTVIGGLGSLTGGVLGAGYYRGADLLPDIWSLVLTGSGLVVVALALPDGLGGLAFKLRDVVLSATARRRTAADDAVDGHRPDGAAVTPVAIGTRGAAASSVTGDVHRAALRIAALEDLEVQRDGGRTRTVADNGAAAGAGASALFGVSGLDVTFGHLQALSDVSFEVAQGEVVALLGTNGAGKTTSLKVAAGLLRPRAGRVHFLGNDITDWTPRQRVEAGLVTVLSGRGVFPSLTVAENLRMATWTSRRGPTAGDIAGTDLAGVLELFPRLGERLDQRAGSLSGGEQQMVALAQALLCRPRMLLIDELSMGLAPTAVHGLLDVVRRLVQGGVTVLVVEQSVNVATSISSRAVFMERGRVRFSGPTPELSQQPKLLRSVFLRAADRAKQRAPAGTSPAAPRRPDDRVVENLAAILSGAAKPGEGRSVVIAPTPALSVAGVSKVYGGVAALTDVSLSVMAGEILGVIGSNGAGKTTLFDVCSGFSAPDGGRVSLFGRDVTALAAPRRAALGLGRVFQDARLFPGMTVTEVVTTAVEQFRTVRDPLAGALRLKAVVDSERAVADRVDELLVQFGLERFGSSYVSELSAGTRRVAELACVVAHDPDVMLLDEPSAGIAQRESEALEEMLLGLRAETGAAFVIIEHDVPLVSSVADRLVCLHLGRTIAEGVTADVLDDPAVVGAYLGSDEHHARRPSPHGAALPPRTLSTGTRR
jgi:ABC-type branched-subunit amino acid transport system ATPase component/ABC-type branched-subunit amino acid transport system permease subunit